jgi:hypothetical protein
MLSLFSSFNQCGAEIFVSAPDPTFKKFLLWLQLRSRISFVQWAPKVKPVFKKSAYFHSKISQASGMIESSGFFCLTDLCQENHIEVKKFEDI